VKLKFNSIYFIDFIKNTFFPGIESCGKKFKIKRVHVRDESGTSYFFDNVKVFHADIEIKEESVNG
jgi:hypothetical protein